MKNPWFFPVAALLLGAAGGFISGRVSSDSATQVGGAEETGPRLRSERTMSALEAERKPVRSRSAEDALRIPGASNRLQSLMDYYSGLSADQLEEEARKLEHLPMGERMMASLLLFGRWAEVDPMAAMTFSDTMGFGGMFVKPTILQGWASSDPVNAAKYYAENARQFAMMDGRGPGGQNAAAIIATEWARQDPSAALAWVQTLDRNKGQALNSVLGEVAKTDPRKATEMLAQLSPEDREGAYGTVANQYGAKDFAEAQVWIRTLPVEQQEAALAEAIRGLSGANPKEAADAIATMKPGEAKNRALETVIGDLARLDPREAVKLLSLQTDADAQAQAMSPLMRNWVVQDASAAFEYVNSQPVGPLYDSAASAYASNNRNAAPASLLPVVEKIQDQRELNRTLSMVAGRWMQENAADARAYIEQSPLLSDRAKERLLDNRRGGGPGGWRGGGPNQ